MQIIAQSYFAPRKYCNSCNISEIAMEMNKKGENEKTIDRKEGGEIEQEN